MTLWPVSAGIGPPLGSGPQSVEGAQQEGAHLGLRPERIGVHPRGSTTADGASLDGQVRDITYLGHAVVYAVSAGPMSVEVRSEGDVGDPFAPGDEVTISWDRGAAAVVAD